MMSGVGFAFAAGILVALLATPLVRAWAVRTGVVARPAEDRWSRREVALMGGVAIFIAALAAVVATWAAFGRLLGLSLAPVEQRASFAIVAMFIVGVIDDRISMRPTVKFACQMIAGAWLVSAGALLSLTGLFPLDAVITMFWFVAVTNAVNLLDNMDGVAAGVSAIASAFLGIALLQQGALMPSIMAFALSGACLGFLRYNFNPASIFMGDAGSLFLGASLATLVTVSPMASSRSVVATLFVPIALVVVPIVDTTLVTMTRLLEGRAVSQGGRDHTTHRLVMLGLSERQTALLLYGFAIVGGTVGLSLGGLSPRTGLAIGLVFLTTLALFAAYLARLHVEHKTAPRGRRDVTQVVSTLMYKRNLAEMFLDVTLVTVAFYGAFWLRFDGVIPAEFSAAFEALIGPVIAAQIVLVAACGSYRGTWRYFSLQDATRIALACLMVVFLILTVAAPFVPVMGGTRSIAVIYGLLASAFMIGARNSFRLLDTLRGAFVRRGEPAIIYGAGDAGALAVRELSNNKSLGLIPVCFLDDDTRKHGTRIHGVYVHGGIETASTALRSHDCRRIILGTRKLRPEILAELDRIAATGAIELVELEIQMRPNVTPRNGVPTVTPEMIALVEQARAETGNGKATVGAVHEPSGGKTDVPSMNEPPRRKEPVSGERALA